MLRQNMIAYPENIQKVTAPEALIIVIEVSG